MNMQFRELDLYDMPLLLDWLGRAHVKRWWDDGDDTLEKVQEHYTRHPDTTKRFLRPGQGQNPIGYFQYYINEDSIGIDQFLADESNLGKGMGTKAIRQFIRMICDKHSPRVIVVDPSPANKQAIRCYEEVGFKHSKVVLGKDGEMAYIMELDPSSLK